MADPTTSPPRPLASAPQGPSRASPPSLAPRKALLLPSLDNHQTRHLSGNGDLSLDDPAPRSSAPVFFTPTENFSSPLKERPERVRFERAATINDRSMMPASPRQPMPRAGTGSGLLPTLSLPHSQSAQSLPRSTSPALVSPSGKSLTSGQGRHGPSPLSGAAGIPLYKSSALQPTSPIPSFTSGQTAGGRSPIPLPYSGIGKSNRITLEDLKKAKEARNSMNGQEGSAPLSWAGVAPKRFVLLRGSTVVRETDLSQMYSLFLECLSIGGGELTVESIRTYITRALKNPSGNSSVVELAASMVKSLSRRDHRTLSRRLGFADMLGILFPRAEPDEIDFLSVSAQEHRTTILNKDGSQTALVPLTFDQLKLANEIYELHEKTSEGHLSIAKLVLDLVNIFGHDEHLLQKQLRRANPTSTTHLDSEGLHRFLGLNLGSADVIDLSAWKASLIGADVVLSRFVHRGEGKTDKELLQDLKDAKPESMLLSKMRRVQKKH